MHPGWRQVLAQVVGLPPANHVGLSPLLLASPGPAQAIAGFWGMNQQMRAFLCLFLYCLQKTKEVWLQSENMLGCEEVTGAGSRGTWLRETHCL